MVNENKIAKIFAGGILRSKWEKVFFISCLNFSINFLDILEYEELQEW